MLQRSSILVALERMTDPLEMRRLDRYYGGTPACEENFSTNIPSAMSTVFDMSDDDPDIVDMSDDVYNATDHGNAYWRCGVCCHDMNSSESNHCTSCFRHFNSTLRGTHSQLKQIG